MLCVLAALGVRPIARAAWPSYAVRSACPLTDADLDDVSDTEKPHTKVGELTALDPWGHPFRVGTLTWHDARDGRDHEQRQIWSAGPNGVIDAFGKGDDVRVESGTLGHVDGIYWPHEFVYLDWSPLIFGGVALLLGWAFMAVAFARKPRSASLAREVVRAAVVASLPAAGALAFAWLEVRGPELLPSPLRFELSGAGRELEKQLLALPLPYAVAGGIALLSFVVVLGLRHRESFPRESDETPEADAAPRLKRRHLVLAVTLALVALALVTIAPVVSSRLASRRRARMGAAAELGIGKAVSELLETGDLDLARDFVAHVPPTFDYRQLDAKSFQALARLGADALPTMVAALAQAEDGWIVPWDHVRAWDEHLAQLSSAVVASPRAYSRFLFEDPKLFAAGMGRRRALAALATCLEDTRPGNYYWRGYRMRLCDSAAWQMATLAEREDEWGFTRASSNVDDTEGWAAAWKSARDAWRAGLPDLAPASWVFVTAHGLVPDSNPTKTLHLEIWGVGATLFHATGYGRSAYTAIGPLAPGPRTLGLADHVAKGGVIDVSIDLRAGETAWVSADFATGHVTTTTTRPGEETGR